jgi:general secretion pathway protein G
MGLAMRIGRPYFRNWRPQSEAGVAVRGFSLMELMVVLTLIMILASFAVPTYQRSILRAREAVLREDLFTMRKVIDEYTLDKQYPPSTLDDLVSAGYLRGGVPADPFTGSNQTWQVVTEDVPMSPTQSASGIVDVHSGSDDESMEGTPYSSW